MGDEVFNLFDQNVTQWFQASIGTPTKVQIEAWPAIIRKENVLVSAPTGTGKTLSAFLVFIDQMLAEAKQGTLKKQLQLIYISPLKSLAGDIRENLKRPLEGIEKEEGTPAIEVFIRTGDTTSAQRRNMLKNPPHILITTPESLYLLLTSKSGKNILRTARAVIIDELHALIDTKRGAHLMLSLARLDLLCGRNLQRIGLSATIEPQSIAASYLSSHENDKVTIVAPSMLKEMVITITSPFSDTVRFSKKDPVWEELARKVYDHCLESRSVMAFVEGRRFAEKLAYYVNKLGGEGFAMTHHGSMSKEQRLLVEDDLRSGNLRLLCATSSMELGIDVGEIDKVLQIGCPKTISATMQRLGRAGHNPGRVSLMHMFPRTGSEGLYCGMTAQVAKEGGVEYAKPPEKCFDVLAQHLVSMALDEPYSIDYVMEVLSHSYSFRKVTREEVKGILCMLAGDYEHDREIPVRPRILYDRIKEQVEGDAYSRMLAVSSGGTIPDRGMYTVKTSEGVKLGELDEVFVFESNRGEKFLLGTFAWKIIGQDKDTVIVTQAPVDGAKLPFWKGELKGRSLKTSLRFGEILRGLQEAKTKGVLIEQLKKMGLDQAAAENADSFIGRQIAATGNLPDDKTIIIEHFHDDSGGVQLMIHSLFGRQVNTPLSLLLQYEIQRTMNFNFGVVDEEDGFLIYPYDGKEMPEHILDVLVPERARAVLEALLPSTMVFNMSFRYNAARALMMGVKGHGRTPLWVQRMRSADMQSQLAGYKEHPLIVETTRECLSYLWDLEGLNYVLNGIRSGSILVREVYTLMPSPMSIPLQRQVEAASMYDYAPTPQNIHAEVAKNLSQTEMIVPAPEAIAEMTKKKKLPEDENQLHTFLMVEGDLEALELTLPLEWLLHLSEKERVFYMEPGLWIAMEHKSEYEEALLEGKEKARDHIVRRMLRYRGPMEETGVSERYFWTNEETKKVLERLLSSEQVVLADGFYYHKEVYDKARRQTIQNMRKQAVTLPGDRYAALVLSRMRTTAPSVEQLQRAISSLCGMSYPAVLWETVLLPARVDRYRESLLDQLLSGGTFFWVYKKGMLVFYKYEDINFEAKALGEEEALTEEEGILYEFLNKRGASFMNTVSHLLGGASPHDSLLSLVEKGLVCADSFVPVRQCMGKEKQKKAVMRQRVGAKVMTLNAGRFDLVRSLKELSIEERLEQAFNLVYILCRETAAICGLPFAEALNVLRIWEYTGRARRGYFISGLSGAQFIREKDYPSITHTLQNKSTSLMWINAADIAFIWGKVLPHRKGREVMAVAGNMVAMEGGIPVMSVERQGKTVRVFENGREQEVFGLFVEDFKAKRIFPNLKRMVVKDYPQEMCTVFSACGFIKEMGDYVLYR